MPSSKAPYLLLNETIVKNEAREIKEQKKAKFAKEITKITFGNFPIKPTFSHEHANKYSKERYSTPVTVDPTKLEWSNPTTPYDFTPYKAKDIMEAVNKKCSNSAPGDNGILYDYL